MQDDTSAMDHTPSEDAPESIWLRGLWSLILIILFGIAETLLFFVAVIQFLWMLFSRKRNQFLVDFGASLAKWLAKTARFQSAASEEKPFPWSRWE